MELTLADIWQTREAWQTVMRLPVKAATALQLIRLHRALEPELKAVAEIQDRLINAHGKDGKLSAAMEGWPVFLKEMNEALAVKVTIPDFSITLPATVEIDAATLMALEKWVKVEEK